VQISKELDVYYKEQSQLEKPVEKKESVREAM